MEMIDIIGKIRNEFIKNADEKTKTSSQRFFKESIKCYGVKAQIVNKISKDNFKQLKALTKIEIFELTENFWKSKVLEESLVACNWTYSLRKEFRLDDFEIFKNWIELYIANWASCDSFCNHSMGKLIEMYPELLPELKKFTKSENRWMRRASAVSLIVPAKKGLFLDTIFEIADKLLFDKDDLVQKGYGWMLKAASQADEPKVFDYVMKNKSIMPRTALRYAVEKMPQDLRLLAMSK